MTVGNLTQVGDGPVRSAYRTNWGRMFQGDCETLLKLRPLDRFKGRAQLILTSPPFPLNRKKKYGNFTGDEYVEWLAALAPIMAEYLNPTGSIVLELGNAWVPGKPTMSTLTIKALLGFLEGANLHLCQEFICFNPARLPSPAQWVNVERIRVKDSFTRVWWMSPTERPKANNRNVLVPYGKDMEELLRRGTYNFGRRPSGHKIGQTSFLTNNGGAIPPNVLVGPPLDDTPDPEALLPIPNTRSDEAYQEYCRLESINAHPARMQDRLAEFFVRFLTDPGDLVLDPFAGSNTTGQVAERLKRRWLGIEMDPDYVKGSEIRVRPELLQLAREREATTQVTCSVSSSAN